MKNRMYRNKNRISSTFAARYNLTKLVYYEKFKFPMWQLKGKNN
ncbi:MAG: hypothetical protein AAFX53_15900 [Bacteroidota bacterium]